MSLVKVGNTYHVRKMVNGVALQRSTKTSNKKLAQQIEAKLVSEHVNDIVLNNTKPISLHAVIDRFIASRNGTAGQKNAKAHLEAFKVLPDQPLKQVTLQQLEAVIADAKEAGFALSTLASRVLYWNALVNYCKEHGYTAAPKLKPIQGVQHKVRYLTKDEQTAFLNAVAPTASDTGFHKQCKQDNWDLCVMLLDTGARYNEISDLTWSQVNLEAGTVAIARSKGGTSTVLGLTTRCKAVLTRRRGIDAAYVFPTKVGKNNNAQWVERAVRDAGISEAAGSVTLHTLRHTFASTVLQAGLDLASLQMLLGHKSITTTMVYAHLVPMDAAAKAAAILDA